MATHDKKKEGSEKSENIRVKEWLQKEGYPLEMKAALIFEESGFNVTQGVHYEDLITNKYREIDLVAQIRKATANKSFEIILQCIVECKYSKDKPWIIFSTTTGHQQRIIKDIRRGQEGSAYNLISNLSEIKELPKKGIINGPERTAYGGTLAFKDNNKDETFPALVKLSEILYSGALTKELPHILISRDAAVFTMGLILVDGSIYDARMIKSELDLNKIDFGRLKWGGRGTENNIIIDIVTFNYLHIYLEKMLNELKIILLACESRPELYNKNMYLEKMQKIITDIKKKKS
jgi:hypothetical protein